MRRIGRYSLRLLAMPIVLFFTGVGVGLVLFWTVSGRALVSRAATGWISSQIAGRVELGTIGGNLIDHLTLDGVRITDSLGEQVIRTPHLDVRYRLADLLAGRMVFTAVTIDSADIHMVKLARGGWNYEAVFRADRPATPGGAPRLVRLEQLQVRNSTVRVDVPSSPHSPRFPVTRNSAAPEQPRIEWRGDSLVRVYTFDRVNADIPLLRISTPDHLPLFARIASLATEVNDPHLILTGFQGEILTAGDTLRFTLDHAEMPNTRVKGGGAVRWPGDSLKFDFALDAERADLKDLKWVSPDFPDWQGAAHLVAYSPSGSRTEYRLDHLTMGNGAAHASGKVVAVVDNSRGLGVRDLDLTLQSVPLAVMRPYLDTIPLAGTLTGALSGDGFLDALHLAGDLNFRDSLVAGVPSSHLVIDGTVHFGGEAGAIFEDFRLRQSDIALATVHRISPSMVLPGTLHLDGHLDGPWQNADFVGTTEHHAPNGAVSRLVGAVRLDTRDSILGFAVNGDFDQLSFDALRTGYPDLTARGGLVGHMVAKGTLASFEVDGQLTGDIGTVRAKGRMAAMSPRFSADSLDLDLVRFDLDALLNNGQGSSLNGHLLITGTMDTLVPPRGRVELALDRSRVGGLTFSSATAHLSAANGILTFDTATMVWPNGSLSARGTLGWAAPDSGTLSMEAHATALTSLDSLVRATLGFAPDTLHPQKFDGQATANFEVHGSRDRMQVAGSVEATNLVLDDWHVQHVRGSLTADSLGARSLGVDAMIDSLRQGERLVDSIHLVASGRTDSLRLDGQLRMGDLMASGRGSRIVRDSATLFGVERLALDFPRQQWRLLDPVRFLSSGQRTVLEDTVRLQARDGSGLITLAGSVPGSEAGDLGVSVVGLNMVDLYGVLQRDTTVLSGLASTDFRLGGTRIAPTLRGNATLTGPVSGDVRAPLVRATFDYREKRLRSNVAFWATGESILDADVSLPLDLALEPRKERRLPGPISITAQADSIDLLVMEALLPGVRNTRGSMRLNFEASGTWDAPKLLGDVALHGAEMTVPALGVRYTGIGGSANFRGDSLVVDSLTMHSGDGTLLVDGSVRFTELSNALLNLRLSASDFLAMDVSTLVRLRPTGRVTLTGPLLHPVMRSLNGAPILLTGSVLYFADLISKNVLDPTDPLLRDLIDTVAIRRQGLGADFQSRFLDSLRIEDITFEIGNDVWLRSSEANVQLEGRVTASKIRKQYRLVGNLNAPRGTYTLRIAGAFPRSFKVESGSVQYDGFTDLSLASLNLSASHTVHATGGEDVEILARITGTIAVPSLTLSSPGRNLNDNEIVSYLAVGRPDLQLRGTQLLQEGVAALGSEAQRSLLSAGIPLDLFEIRPGIASGTDGAALQQVAIGKQLGPKWFVMATAGICVGPNSTSSFSRRNLGASLEYRMTSEFRWQASAEPVQSCQSSRTSDVFATLSRYQLGGDLLWTREY